jgi:hypothetical protein
VCLPTADKTVVTDALNDMTGGLDEDKANNMLLHHCSHNLLASSS